MNPDDLTVLDMLNDMSTAEFAEFAVEHRRKVRSAIVNGHYAAGGPDWRDELDAFQQRVRDGEADAKQQERDFRRSKGVL